MKLSLAVTIFALAGMHVSGRASGQAHNGLQLRSLQGTGKRHNSEGDGGEGGAQEHEDEDEGPHELGDGQQRHGKCNQNGGVRDQEGAQEGKGPGEGQGKGPGKGPNALRHLPQEPGDLEPEDKESGQKGGSLRGEKRGCQDDEERNNYGANSKGQQEDGRTEDDEDGNEQKPDRPRGNCTPGGDCEGDGPSSDKLPDETNGGNEERDDNGPNSKGPQEDGRKKDDESGNEQKPDRSRGNCTPGGDCEGDGPNPDKLPDETNGGNEERNDNGPNSKGPQEDGRKKDDEDGIEQKPDRPRGNCTPGGDCEDDEPNPDKLPNETNGGTGPHGRGSN